MKVSIVIPAYNSENTIERCLKSIKKQSYENFEAIIIDDGSIDDSLNVIQKFIENDDRFFVIYQANNGVSSARNKGLERVTGEFITFLDSDDELSEEYLEELIADCLSRPDIDLVCQGIIKIFSDNKIIVPEEKLQCFKSDDYVGLFRDAKISLKGNPVSKLFKSEIISKHDLKFNTDITYNEDKIFVLEYIYCCKGEILFSNISNYKYFINTGSLSHSILKPDDYWRPYKYFKNLLKKKFQVNYKNPEYEIIYENFKRYLHMYVNAVFVHESKNEKDYFTRFNNEDWAIYKYLSKNKSSPFRKVFDFFFIRGELEILRLFSKIYLKSKFK
jgi:glycosyltransferase involved in cell wall biosynthesis